LFHYTSQAPKEKKAHSGHPPLIPLNRDHLMETAWLVTGQLSTHIPQPVQMSAFTLRALFPILTLKHPAEPSTDSISA